MTSLVPPPAPPAARPPSTGRAWALLPAGLLGSLVIGQVVMIRIAVDDPGFSVERDYYAKAVAWEDHQAELAENERLGWQLAVTPGATSAAGTPLRVALTAPGGAPLEGARVRAEAFPVARGRETVELAFTSAGAAHESVLGARRGGLWELRFLVERGAERFTAVRRVDLPGSATP